MSNSTQDVTKSEKDVMEDLHQQVLRGRRQNEEQSVALMGKAIEFARKAWKLGGMETTPNYDLCIVTLAVKIRETLYADPPPPSERVPGSGGKR